MAEFGQKRTSLRSENAGPSKKRVRASNMFTKISKTVLLIFGNVFVAFSRIEIDVADNVRLAIDVNTRKIVANKASQTVSSSGRLLARFATLQSIHIEHFINGKRLEWWTVSLQLLGGRKILICKSVDEAQLAFIAAHLGTLTGKKVCAFSKAGW